MKRWTALLLSVFVFVVFTQGVASAEPWYKRWYKKAKTMVQKQAVQEDAEEASGEDVKGEEAGEEVSAGGQLRDNALKPPAVKKAAETAAVKLPAAQTTPKIQTLPVSGPVSRTQQVGGPQAVGVRDRLPELPVGPASGAGVRRNNLPNAPRTVAPPNINSQLPPSTPKVPTTGAPKRLPRAGE